MTATIVLPIHLGPPETVRPVEVVLAKPCRNCDDGKLYGEIFDPLGDTDEDGFLLDSFCGECDGDGQVITPEGKAILELVHIGTARGGPY